MIPFLRLCGSMAECQDSSFCSGFMFITENAWENAQKNEISAEKNDEIGYNSNKNCKFAT